MDRLDLSTLIMFGNKRSDDYLRPLGGPWLLISQRRNLAQRQIMEDIDYYHRVHDMLSVFRATDSRQNYNGERNLRNYLESRVGNGNIHSTLLKCMPNAQTTTVIKTIRQDG